jgi:hypothetical protein
MHLANASDSQLFVLLLVGTFRLHNENAYSKDKQSVVWACLKSTKASVARGTDLAA